MSGLSHMWKTEGVRGLFKGNGANCVRIVPNSAVKFFCYEHMAHGLLEFRRAFDENPVGELIIEVFITRSPRSRKKRD